MGIGWNIANGARRTCHALDPLGKCKCSTVETGGGDRSNGVEDRFKFSKRRDKVEFDGV